MPAEPPQYINNLYVVCKKKEEENSWVEWGQRSYKVADHSIFQENKTTNKTD